MVVKKNSQLNQVSIKKDQRVRFIEAARAAECSEDESVFDENLRKIARHQPVAAPAPKPTRQPRSK